MTNDGELLFRAICEQPGEDTPRLVYADWLQENGQAERAEFVRLQCEAWGPAFAAPAAARTRASELLRAHRDRWDAELPAMQGLEWGEFYVRGFVDVARLFGPDRLTVTLERAFAAAPVRFLYVARLQPGQLRELLAFPHLGRLARLNLPGIYGEGEARTVIAAQQRFPNTDIT